MENPLVNELVTNLIQNKTIKSDDRDSISTILSNAINSIPSSQLPIFKKRIEKLAESSNQSIFTEAGVNIGALQATISNIVKDVEKNTISHSDTSIINDKQSSNDFNPLANSEHTNLLEFDPNNFFDYDIENDPLAKKDSPEYKKAVADAYDNLSKKYLKNADSPQIDESSTSGAPSQPELSLEGDITQEENEIYLQALAENTTDLERFFKIYFSLQNQLGFSSAQAQTKALSKCNLTLEDISENGKFHNRYVITFHEMIENNAKKENKSVQELLDMFPNLDPEKDPLLGSTLSSHDQTAIRTNNSAYFQNLFNQDRRFFIGRERKENKVNRCTANFDLATQKLKEYQKNISSFNMEDYLKLIQEQSRAETALAEANRDLTNLINPNAPIRKEIQDATMDFFLTDKSVSEIYYELKDKYPYELIAFDDILSNVMNISKKILPLYDYTVLENSEKELHQKNQAMHAIIWSNENGINSIDNNRLNQAQKSYEFSTSNPRSYSRARKEVICESIGLVFQGNDNSPLKNNLFSNLFSQVTILHSKGISETDAVSQALKNLDIKEEDLHADGKYHDLMKDFFAKHTQKIGLTAAATLTKHMPILHPSQNLLMKHFFTPEEKEFFASDAAYLQAFNSYNNDKKTSEQQVHETKPRKSSNIIAATNVNSYATPDILEEKTIPKTSGIMAARNMNSYAEPNVVEEKNTQETTTPTPEPTQTVPEPDFEALISQHNLDLDDLNLQNDLIINAIKQPVAVRDSSEVVNDKDKDQDKDQGPEI